ncbi:MAG: RnfABCDGE type electron transport complex subunit A [Clostridia bacterium]
MSYILIIIGAVFVNNFILSQFLGICPFLGVSKKTESALGMGLAVIFVMSVSSVITYAVNLLLVKLNIEYTQTIVFILIIAALVQCVEIIIKKFSPSLYNALGVYLPLITTNCAVLGVAIVNVGKTDGMFDYNMLQAFLNGTFSGVGFTLAIVMMAGIREKLVNSDIPEPFKGFPITLAAASIMSMAFIAFSGII